MESFEELNLPEFLANNLKRMNFVKPTPVQAQAIPAALEGKDVIASAQTGTGKTGAFGVPMVAYLHAHPEKTALVMTPTRELAQQVLDVARKFGGQVIGGPALLIGGANMQGQFISLKRKPRLIIGTPGRIIDHLTRGSLNLSSTGFLVLDEADRMLDMGFAPQLDEIKKKLPPVRQTLLFSATFPPDIQRVASGYLKDPVRITIGSTSRPVEKINQEVVYTTESHKFEQLMLELKERRGSVVIFARTQVRVDRVFDKLKDLEIKVTRIHGGRTQSQRRQAIEQFREGKFLVLVATDIAARGLDIHHIAHVINYDLPKNPEDYIHRVGRTARAGAEGNSLCLLTPEDRNLWERILRLLGPAKGAVKVKQSAHPGFAHQTAVSGKPAFKKEHQGDRHERPSFKRQEGSERRDRGFGHRENRFEGKREGFRNDRGERPSHFDREKRHEGGNRFEHREQRHEGGHRPEGRERFEGNRDRHDHSGPKQRHPGGRHERRSEQHRMRTEGNTSSAGETHRSFDQNSGQQRPPFARPFQQQGFKKEFRGGDRQGSSTPWGEMGQQRRFDRNDRQDRGERRSFGDRKPFNGERKSFGDRPSFGGKKNFGERKSFGARPAFGEKKHFGDRKSFGERKSFGDRPSFGEKKHFGERKSFGNKPTFGGKKHFGDRKPFSGGGDRPPRRFGKPDHGH